MAILSMGRKSRVEFMYGLAWANWYDPFRKLWTRHVCQQAENDLTESLKLISSSESVILDLGCGTGFNIARLLNNDIPFSHYNGLDGSSHMLNQAKRKYDSHQKLSFHQKDITNASEFKADIIICTWVMSHLDEPANVINQWQSALNPGGTVLCIFLSKPHWCIDIWLRPFAIASQCKYVDDTQIKLLNNLTELRQYSQQLVSFATIKNTEIFPSD